jgi:hypothetical protein
MPRLGFSTTLSSNTVKFNGIAAAVTAATSTSLTLYGVNAKIATSVKERVERVFDNKLSTAS